MAKNSMGVRHIKATEAMKEMVIHLNITHLKTLKIKLKIGMLFIKLACWIMGCGIKIEGENK